MNVQTRDHTEEETHGVLVLPTQESRNMTMNEFRKLFPNAKAASVHKFDDWYLTLLVAEAPDNEEAPVNRVASTLYWFGRTDREEGKYVRGPVFVCDDYRPILASQFALILHSLRSTSGDTCRKCGKTYSDLKRCGGCKSLHYCSRQCATGDWKRHKPHCNKRPKADFIVQVDEESIK